MYPLFPNFKVVDLKDKDLIEKFTNKFEPYSDFNFVSLLTWNISNTSAYSFLNDNLVIKLSDYMTNETVYSLLGKNAIDDTLYTLFKLTNKLKYVPEITVNNIVNISNFAISEDRDEFDYIYNTDELINLPGKKHKTTRNKVNHFVKNCPEKLKLEHISFNDKKCRDSIIDIFKSWKTYRGSDDKESRNELAAIGRLLDVGTNINLSGVIVFIDNKPAGFSINEVLPNKYCVCHFQKTSYTHKNLDPFITNLVSREMKHYGSDFYNWEQDLGIDGLRQLKTTYKNTKFLKKYQVRVISGAL